MGLWRSGIIYGTIFCVAEGQHIPKCWSFDLCIRCWESWIGQWHALLSIMFGGDLQGKQHQQQQQQDNRDTNWFRFSFSFRIHPKRKSFVSSTKWIWWPKSSVTSYSRNARKTWSVCHCRWNAPAIARASGTKHCTVPGRTSFICWYQTWRRSSIRYRILPTSLTPMKCCCSNGPHF